MLSFSHLPSFYYGLPALERGFKHSIDSDLLLDFGSITSVTVVISYFVVSTVFGPATLVKLAAIVKVVRVIAIAIVGQGFGFDRF